MTLVIQKLSELGIAHPPKFLPTNVHYQTLMGSVAYGVSTNDSDMDVYGFCIPPMADIFPHLSGEIMGFGRQHNRFEQYQEHHLSLGEKEYDISIYSIVKYFQLCMENNPNMIDSLFTPANCILQITPIGQMVRDSRHLFLHKGSYHKFRGYSFSQMAKAENADRKESKRRELIEKYGYDIKSAYHVVRLLEESEQILAEHTISLTRSAEVLKSIRRGEWTLADIKSYFSRKEVALEELYHSSTLPYGPDEEKIKNLLLNCLEAHFGSLNNVIYSPGKDRAALQEIAEVINRALH